MNDLLVVILCYSRDVAFVEHQLPYYLHHRAPILLLSPEDAPACIDHPQIVCKSAGMNDWAGRAACSRFLEHLHLMLEWPNEWFIVFEPDSICLSPELPGYLFESTDQIWSIPFGSIEGGDYNTPPPWFGHRDAWRRAVAAMDEHYEEWMNASDAVEGWGHGTGEMIAEVVNVGAVRPGAYHDAGWTYTESSPQDLYDAAVRGAPFHVGFKWPATFDALVEAYEARETS